MKTRLTSRFPACLLGVSSENQDINCETEHLGWRALGTAVGWPDPAGCSLDTWCDESPGLLPLCTSWDWGTHNTRTTRLNDYSASLLPWAEGHQHTAIYDFGPAMLGTGCAFSVAQKLRAWAKVESNSDRRERRGE